MTDLARIAERDAPVRALAEALRAGRRVVATGNVGPSVSLTALAVARMLSRTVIVACAHTDEAEDIGAEINALEPHAATIIPALELAPGESSVSAELFAQRATVLRRLRDGHAPRVLVAPVASLMQPAPSPTRLDALVRTIRRGDAPGLSHLIDWLTTAGYDRVETVEDPGQFAVRGGILDIFSPVSGESGPPAPVRLDFFGDEVDSLREFDLETMGSDRALDSCTLAAAGQSAIGESKDDTSVLAYAPEGTVAILAETFEVVEQARGYFERVSDGRTIYPPPAVLKALADRTHALAELNQFSAGAATADVRIELPVSPLPAFDKDAARAVTELADLARTARVVLACASDAESARLGELISTHAPGVDIERRVIDIRRGMIWGGWGEEEAPPRTALVPSGELLHRSSVRRRVSKIRAGRAMDTFLEIGDGDFVVHADHGIAKFIGLTVLPAGGTKHDKPVHPSQKKKPDDRAMEEYLTLEFASKSRLHVPCSQIDLVQKYIGGFRGKPQLSTSAAASGKARKNASPTPSATSPPNSSASAPPASTCPAPPTPATPRGRKEFEAEFPYEETEDQLAALAEIKKDMPARAHGPPHLRRCRLRQDRTRHPRRLQGLRVRQAGRGAGAHHRPRRAARTHLPLPLRRLPLPRRVLSRFKTDFKESRTPSRPPQGSRSMSSSARTACSPRMSSSPISAWLSSTRSNASASSTRRPSSSSA
jgi:transcription-repair coupling factor (superfamily II helicase)